MVHSADVSRSCR
jgi:hypothetical protein